MYETQRRYGIVVDSCCVERPLARRRSFCLEQSFVFKKAAFAPHVPPTRYENAVEVSMSSGVAKYNQERCIIDLEAILCSADVLPLQKLL